MLVLKAFKFRLRVNKTRELTLRRWAGSCRWLWNQALAAQKERLESNEKVESYAALCRRLTAWKGEHDWLYQTPHHSLQQALKTLDRAFKDWRSMPERGRPRFKKRGRCQDSIRFPVAPKIEGDRIKLPKLGWIRFRKSREITGTVKNATLSRRGPHWFVSIQTEQELADPVHPSSSEVGIDLGVKRFATLNDGRFFEPLDSFRRLENKLAWLQRSLARKVKGSANWLKARFQVTKLHIKIADARNDFLHKASTQICKNHALICVEDLKVKNMSKSAKGTVEAPGKGVKAKSGLNRAILDQGWYEFRRQLEYKAQWRGGRVVAVDAKNSSRRCHKCGHTAAENRRTQAGFVCQSCGLEAHADVNAAKNILFRGSLAVGQTVSACGEQPLGSR